jgi:hypothetical protein
MGVELWTGPLTQLGPEGYRVDGLSGCLDDPDEKNRLLYHDIIEAQETELPRLLRFVGVLERSQEMLEFLVPRDFFYTADLKALLRWVTAQDGSSALDMGALLLVSLPSQAKGYFMSEYVRIADLYNATLPVDE